MHYSKKLRDLTKDEVISLHIDAESASSSTSDFLIKSTLSVILHETRHCSLQSKSSNIMPFLGFFSLLDQVGNTYFRKDLDEYKDKNASGIKKALYYFRGYGDNDNETQSLYALRNALMHNSSLQNNNNGHYHSFRYDSQTDHLVIPAINAWNGSIFDLGEENITVVNPGLITENLNKTIESLLECNENKTLCTEKDRVDIISNFLLLKSK